MAAGLLSRACTSLTAADLESLIAASACGDGRPKRKERGSTQTRATRHSRRSWAKTMGGINMRSARAAAAEATDNGGRTRGRSEVVKRGARSGARERNK